MSASSARIPDEPPFPKVVLFGCRPHVPYRGIAGDGPDAYPPFHVPGPDAVAKPTRRGKGDAPDPSGKFPGDARCPTCKGRIGRGPAGEPLALTQADPAYWDYCESCAAMAPVHDRKASDARQGLTARSRAEDAERRARDELRRRHAGLLSESERRRLWNGYRGGIHAESAEVTNRAKVGRDWLIAIGQPPDWSLDLDAKGRVIRRARSPEAT